MLNFNVKCYESCKVDFPKKNSKIGSDLVVVHKERCMRPNFDSFGKRGELILTTQTWKIVLLSQKVVPLEMTSLFLERQIVYVSFSQFETITRTFRILKTRTTF